MGTSLETRLTGNQLHTILSSCHIRYANGVATFKQPPLKPGLQSSGGRGASLQYTQIGAIVQRRNRHEEHKKKNSSNPALARQDSNRTSSGKSKKTKKQKTKKQLLLVPAQRQWGRVNGLSPRPSFGARQVLIKSHAVSTVKFAALI